MLVVDYASSTNLPRTAALATILVLVMIAVLLICFWIGERFAEGNDGMSGLVSGRTVEWLADIRLCLAWPCLCLPLPALTVLVVFLLCHQQVSGPADPWLLVRVV